MNPKVSIIVPVYNVEKYVEKCIGSLISQTEKEIEIIIINDGSQDTSGKLCDSLASTDKRIRVIHSENMGVSIARNIGIREARGEWISFVDGDDYARPDMIETLLKKSYEADYDVIIADYYVEGANHEKRIEYFFHDECVFSNESKKELIQASVLGNVKNTTTVGVPWAKIYARDFLVDKGLTFLEGLKRMQDMIFNIHVFKHARSIKYVHSPVYYYRTRNDSVVNKYVPEYGDTIKTIVNQLYEYGENEYEYNDWDEVLDARKIGLFIEWCKLYPCNRECRLDIGERIHIISDKYTELLSNVKNTKYFSFRQKFIRQLAEANLFYVVFFLLTTRHISKQRKRQ